ncbi:ganglioside-induced differentiation-associated protein 1-like [Gigantopelta aegis]|uniref:ganglioside-induced differentiation-associated protein 1-like n=1 Tax=Gigantopelta aegis TaxID=1735272 RepID=UPI001B88C7A9|nr:ganglioside-induced differentiation-associated protein 1-like [Gigantopelta aegis]
MEGKSQQSYDLSSDAGSQNVTFYYFPTSYSSQKVLLALFEKKVKFRPKLVSLFHAQHMEPWYVKLNPEGVHVPVLRDNDIVINNPDDIISYIDTNSDSGPTLVPCPDTALGQSVASLREQLNLVPVDIITYGIIFHPHLSPTGCGIPSAIQRSMRENFANRLCYLANKATKYPNLRDGYLARSQIAAQKYDIITDEEKVKGQLYHLDTVFEDVESVLKNTKERHNIDVETFLFGTEFTAADITLSILLHRLALLGLESRFFAPNKSPNIQRYYERIQRRRTFQRIQEEVDELRWTLVWEDVKAASPYMASAAGIGLTLLITYYLVKSLIRR